MAEGLEPRPFSSAMFTIKNFSDSTTPITPDGKWYTLNCAVTGKRMIGLAGFGVDYPNNMSITNITVAYNGVVSLFIQNSSDTNKYGFNVVGLYVDN